MGLGCFVSMVPILSHLDSVVFVSVDFNCFCLTGGVSQRWWVVGLLNGVLAAVLSSWVAR